MFFKLSSFLGVKTTPSSTPIATYLTHLASNATKSASKSVQEQLTAKATKATLQHHMTSSTKSETPIKTYKSMNDNSNNKKPFTSTTVLYENAEKNMRTIHKIIDDPVRLIKHELRAWKQRKKDLKGIFVLDKHKLKKLARRAGMREVEGYAYNTKQSNGTFAQYGLPRPNFETAWKFHVLNARSFSSIGHLLRILHCCLRWDVINIRPPKGVNHAITTSKGKSGNFYNRRGS